MSEEESVFIDIGGQQIHYRVKGKGPPLVFVHGWTLNLSYWDKQVDYFSRRYCTYAYDWRGMGQSSADGSHFTLAQLADELAGVIEAFNLDRPFICGHSEGGAIAIQYAEMHPDKLSGLILANTALNTTIEKIEGVIEFSLARLFLKLESSRGHNPLESMLPKLQKKLYSDAFITSHPEFIDKWQKQFISNSLEGVLNGLRAWEWRPKINKQLQNVKVHTLLLWGMDDVMIPLEELQELQANLRESSQLTTLRGAGHMSPVEQPDRFNQVMDAFLESIRT